MADQGLRILLADDQVLFAETLCTLLNNYAEDIVVVGLAENGEKAVAMTREHKPNIILMDVRMPQLDGVEAVRIIKEEFPEIKIIMLSTYREDDLVRASLMAGASGYLLKDISPTELITAIRALDSGIMQISPEIVKQLIQRQYSSYDRSIEKPSEKTSEKPNEKSKETEAYNPVENGQFEWIHTLTRRERELFILIATGYDNEEIAEKLNLSLQTVMNMVSTVYSKLGVKDRFEIIRLANSKKT
jgi:DNA-binding NarL/FixJ family response regulator